jgi:hypothetical protein
VILAKIGPTPTEGKTPDEVLASYGPAPQFSGREKPAVTPDATGEQEEIVGPAPASASVAVKAVRVPARPAASVKPANKPVVKEEPGDENNEEQAAGEDPSPDDGE